VVVQDGEVEHVALNDEGVEALILAGGERVTADLFVDASGFRSELLGRALQLPFKSYADALFCDRAVIGAWARTNEVIKPYTVAETMDHGWAWQIEHETVINRGYVYSSRFVDDDTARAEYLRKNPKANPEQTRVVKFRAGRYDTMWKGNVVGVGNAAGFVEPLEATSLQVIILQCRSLADCLLDSQMKPSPSVKAFYNRVINTSWDEIRDFLAVHYKFNTRLNTPFWKACREEISIGNAQEVYEFYVENGPSALANNYLLSAQNPFGMDGYLTMFIGQGVPHLRIGQVAPADMAAWRRAAADAASVASAGFTVAEALARIRQPDWKWS
jgi:tryptophan halogenase